MRLIYEEKLREDIDNIIIKDMATNLNKKITGDMVLNLTSKIIKCIENQPTAFDVSKVLKEFETRRKTYEIEADNVDTPSPYVCYYRGMMRGYQYSKEIIEESLSEVKAGGIDEDRNI